MEPVNELAALRAQVHAYRDFEECVVVGVEWLDWGTSLNVDIDFVWQDDGSVRSTGVSRRIVSIRFLGVSDLHLVNDLVDGMVGGSASVNWGHGEIACLRIEHAAPTRTRLTVPSYRALFRREGYSWFEVVFVQWRIAESVQMASQSPLNEEPS